MRILSAVLLSCSLISAVHVHAQKSGDGDDLMKMLNDDDASKKAKNYTTATFKSTRVVNGHSVENVARGVLDFRIAHRFGELKSGFDGFFGLDGANTALGFDYGITDWAMIGIVRSTYQKEYEGYTKLKLLRQQDGGGMPVTLSYMGAVSVNSTAAPVLKARQEYYFSNRMYYVNQLLIARKISPALSVQIMPSMVHYNLVPTTAEPNNVYAMGVGGRLKLTKRISLNAEYYYRLTKLGNATDVFHNALSLGFDIETGGHVFQLMFTNATGVTERTFIGQTVSDWADGGIRFGFNISRVFTIVKPRGFEGSRNETW
ncbi:MAG: hypothetical protein JST82_01760 [Bacteroidetes bacterium]|nr:hypothetical protein [Bacteroidota bacterium]